MSCCVSVSGCEFFIRDSFHLEPFIDIPFCVTKQVNINKFYMKHMSSSSLCFYFGKHFVTQLCPSRPPLPVYLALRSVVVS